MKMEEKLQGLQEEKHQLFLQLKKVLHEEEKRRRKEQRYPLFGMIHSSLKVCASPASDFLLQWHHNVDLSQLPAQSVHACRTAPPQYSRWDDRETKQDHFSPQSSMFLLSNVIPLINQSKCTEQLWVFILFIKRGKNIQTHLVELQ